MNDLTKRLKTPCPHCGDPCSECAQLMLDAADEIERLRAEINDQDSWYRAVMSETCQQDELHCACVPTLRTEIERLRAQLAAAHDAHAARDVLIESLTKQLAAAETQLVIEREHNPNRVFCQKCQESMPCESCARWSSENESIRTQLAAAEAALAFERTENARWEGVCDELEAEVTRLNHDSKQLGTVQKERDNAIARVRYLESVRDSALELLFKYED